jgi:hypothetical protein
MRFFSTNIAAFMVAMAILPSVRVRMSSARTAACARLTDGRLIMVNHPVINPPVMGLWLLM